MKNIILGAEGIVIHGNKIVLGMQKQKRWYFLENGEKAAIIKTLGGTVEKVDENNTRKTLIREILEEVKGINNKDINVSKQPVFTKEIEIRELNPYEQNSTLKMRADFYTVEIAKDINLKPNDLPALIEIPKEKFYDINNFKYESYQVSNNSYIINVKVSDDTDESKNFTMSFVVKLADSIDKFEMSFEK